jgi:hypothetical protein
VLNRPQNTKISCEGRDRECPDLVSCILLFAGLFLQCERSASTSNPPTTNGTVKAHTTVEAASVLAHRHERETNRGK